MQWTFLVQVPMYCHEYDHLMGFLSRRYFWPSYVAQYLFSSPHDVYTLLCLFFYITVHLFLIQSYQCFGVAMWYERGISKPKRFSPKKESMCSLYFHSWWGSDIVLVIYWLMYFVPVLESVRTILNFRFIFSHWLQNLKGTSKSMTSQVP